MKTALLSLLLMFACESALHAEDYLIVDLVGADDPYYAAAQRLAEFMPQLQGKTMILFGGHGLPREVLGGPTWQDLAGLNFDGAVAMNVACLTGVTGKWFEEDWQHGKKRERLVAKDESFCLAMLRTGVAAYVAYACPRPAGPELFTDFAALAAEGLSVGEVRRRDYNRVVLASIAAGNEKLTLVQEADGQPLTPPRDLVKDPASINLRQ